MVDYKTRKLTAIIVILAIVNQLFFGLILFSRISISIYYLYQSHNLKQLADNHDGSWFQEE